MTSPPNIRLDIDQLIFESVCEITRGETGAAISLTEAEHIFTVDS